MRNAAESVLNQDFPKDQYELIIVDNASSDHTADVSKEIITRFPAVRYVLEPNVGLSNARNCGWQSARGEYVGYLDDDALAASEWLSVAHSIIQNKKPEMFGGPYYPYYLNEKPAWIPDSFGSRSLGDFPRELIFECLSGGNMFVRRNVLERLGGYNVNFGMSLDRIAYSEEVILQRKARLVIPKCVIYYDPRLYIMHIVRLEKTDIFWMVQANFASGRDNYLARRKNSLLLVFINVFSSSAEIILKTIFYSGGVLFRNRKRYPDMRTYIYDKILPLVKKAGHFYASMLILTGKK
jgi:glycosyltransferase involved in cell wall biosynthesis